MVGGVGVDRVIADLSVTIAESDCEAETTLDYNNGGKAEVRALLNECPNSMEIKGFEPQCDPVNFDVQSATCKEGAILPAGDSCDSLPKCLPPV